MCNLSSSYFNSGDFHRALDMSREGLRLFQATLPPFHPYVIQAQEAVRQCEGQCRKKA
jgi:hypothetical protein